MQICQGELKKITAAKRAAGKTAAKANGKKMAAAMKKAGKGIFAPKTLSDALAKVCGVKKAPRTEVTLFFSHVLVLLKKVQQKTWPRLNTTVVRLLENKTMT